jgi:hypothetical protein
MMVYVRNLKEKKPEVYPFDRDEVRRLLAAAVGWERAYLSALIFGGSDQARAWRCIGRILTGSATRCACAAP